MKKLFITLLAKKSFKANSTLNAKTAVSGGGPCRRVGGGYC